MCAGYIHVVLEVIFLTSLCIAGRTRFLIAEFVQWPAWQRFYSPLMRMDFNLLYFVQLLSRWYFPSLRRFRYPRRSISAQWLISWLEYLITFWSDWRLNECSRHWQSKILLALLTIFFLFIIPFWITSLASLVKETLRLQACSRLSDARNKVIGSVQPHEAYG